MKKTITSIFLTIILASVCLQVLPVQAQIGLDKTFIPTSGQSDFLPKVGQASTAEKSFANIMQKATLILLSLAATVALGLMVFSGFKMISSRGEEDELGKAKQMLLWSIIGFVLIILSYGFVVNFANIVFDFLSSP